MKRSEISGYVDGAVALAAAVLMFLTVFLDNWLVETFFSQGFHWRFIHMEAGVVWLALFLGICLLHIPLGIGVVKITEVVCSGRSGK